MYYHYLHYLLVLLHHFKSLTQLMTFSRLKTSILPSITTKYTTNILLKAHYNSILSLITTKMIYFKSLSTPVLLLMLSDIWKKGDFSTNEMENRLVDRNGGWMIPAWLMSVWREDGGVDTFRCILNKCIYSNSIFTVISVLVNIYLLD